MISALRYTGIAPIQIDASKEDPIDEAIKLFRINVLFKNFEIKGDGDRLLIFLTVLIQRVLEIVASAPKPDEANKNLARFAMEPIPGAGDSGFFMGGIVPKAANETENSRFKEYLKQVKAETISRLVHM